MEGPERRAYSGRRSTRRTSPSSSRSGAAFRSAVSWKGRPTVSCGWKVALRARRRPGRGGPGRGTGGPPLPFRSRRPEPTDGDLPVHRPDRGGQDRAREGARLVPLPLRARARPDRHERVHGEAHRRSTDRGPAGVRRLRGGRSADRGGPIPSVHGRAVRRGREGPPGRRERATPAARRRAVDRRAGPDGGLPEHARHHDQQPRIGPAERGDLRRRTAEDHRARLAGALPARVPRTGWTRWSSSTP